MDDEVIVRVANEDDAKNIIEFLKKTFQESDNLIFSVNELKVNELEEREIIKNSIESNNSVFLLAIISGEIIALGSLEGSSKNKVKHHSTLGIIISKDYWHLGVGTLMMDELIEWAINHHIEIIDLVVRNDNKFAIKLYKNFGFERIGIYPNYFKINDNYYDAILMNLKVEE